MIFMKSGLNETDASLRPQDSEETMFTSPAMVRQFGVGKIR